MDLGLGGRVCVVTGASRGIGFAVARRLADEGARLLLVARDESALAAAAESVGGDHLACDVTAVDAGPRIVERAEELGGIDVLVNNAGTMALRPLDTIDDDEWQMQWELNVMASMRLMRVAAPRMAARRWGRIVNVASASGKRPSQRNVAYSVAKAAQLSLSRAFAERWAPEGVLVNAVAPGPAATELWTEPGGLGEQTAGAGHGQEAIETIGASVPLGRFGTPEEIADVIVFLCSERVADVVGSAWSVDGGTVPLAL